PASKINRIRAVGQPLLAMLLFSACFAQLHASGIQQPWMLANLLTHSLHVRGKPVLRHHSRMKIAVSTLRLAERHLHVNSELFHYAKTLAHLSQPRSALRARLSDQCGCQRKPG